MRAYRDTTSDLAIDRTHRQWRRMAALALQIRSGRCKPDYVEEQEKQFTGIFRRLLTDPIDEVKKYISRQF